MVSSELRGRIRGAGGILLQAEDFGVEVQLGIPPHAGEQQRDVCEPGSVIGIVSTDRAVIDFAAAMQEHRSMVFSVAYHFLHDRDQAEEVAQDVFLSLHKN